MGANLVELLGGGPYLPPTRAKTPALLCWSMYIHACYTFICFRALGHAADLKSGGSLDHGTENLTDVLLHFDRYTFKSAAWKRHSLSFSRLARLCSISKPSYARSWSVMVRCVHARL